MTATTTDFYVYALLRENGTPFYIGKGSNRRWLRHEHEARRGGKGHRCRIIRKMLARGIEVPKLKLHEGLTEAAAHEYEVALIAAIGRGKNGPLVNITDGGEGVSGYVPTPEHRAKNGAAHRGRKRSPETCAKMRGPKPPGHGAKVAAALRGRKHSPETIAKLRGRKRSPEHGAKIAAAKRGRKQSPETVAKRAAANRGRMPSPEHRAKVAAGLRGRKHSPEHRARNAAAQRGRKHSPEHNAKIGAALRGRTRSPEHCANIAAALRGRKHSPGTIAKLRGRTRSPESRMKQSATRRANALAKLAAVSHQNENEMKLAA